jgi:hypothetical protein
VAGKGCALSVVAEDDLAALLDGQVLRQRRGVREQHVQTLEELFGEFAVPLAADGQRPPPGRLAEAGPPGRTAQAGPEELRVLGDEPAGRARPPTAPPP